GREEFLGLLDLAGGHHEAGHVIVHPCRKRRGRCLQALDTVEDEAVVNGHDDCGAVARQRATKTIFHRHEISPTFWTGTAAPLALHPSLPTNLVRTRRTIRI